MSSEGTALTLCAAGVGVSMFYQVRQGNDPIPVMVIGGLFTGACVGLSAWNPDVGTALAAVFFLGMFLSRGSELIDFASATAGTKGTRLRTKSKGKAHG